jgi:hypothetical protein
MAEEALALHIEGRIADGDAIPEPSSLETIMADLQNPETPSCAPRRVDPYRLYFQPSKRPASNILRSGRVGEGLRGDITATGIDPWLN